MNIEQYQNYPALSKAVANTLIDAIRLKNNALICVATGNTPIGPYQHFVELAKNTSLDYSKVRFVGLDEWLGLSRDHEGTCHHFLHKHLFDPLQISSKQYKLFNGLANQPEAECNAMN